MSSIKSLRSLFINQLTPLYDPIEAQSLTDMAFTDVLGMVRHQLIIHQNEEINKEKKSKLEEILERLKKHEPIQYVLGHTDFFGCDILVNPSVLIPRPETEELVDLILRDFADKKNKPLAIADYCTGSGCIAVALKKHLKQATITALDISEQALETAISNAQHNHCQGIEFILSDVLGPTYPLNPLDILVSNPPYVTQSEKKLMQNNVLLFEPSIALFVSDSNPLVFYRKIADDGLINLKVGGLIYFECNRKHAKEVLHLLVEKGYRDVELIEDMNRNHRFIKGKK